MKKATEANLKADLSHVKDLYVGIDVHKNKWVITIRSYNLELHTFTMADASAEKLHRHLEREYPGKRYHLVYEAGFSGYSLYDYFHDRGIDIIVTPPTRIPRDGSRIKTDRSDSRKLARLLSRGELKRVCVPRPEIREYRSVVKVHDTIKQQIRQISQRIRSLLYFYGHPLAKMRMSKKLIKQLWEIEFQSVELTMAFRSLLEEYEFYTLKLRESKKRLEQLARRESLSHKVKKLKAIRGIGTESAVKLTVKLFDRDDRFPSGGGATHYVGLTPSENSSGDKERKGRITRNGDRKLRALIIQLAWNVVRWDSALMEKYESVYSRTHSPQKAIVAVARKLIVRLYTIIMRDEEYVRGLAA
jgi:transposase